MSTTALVDWQRRWYSRMIFSRRQLQEKMVLLWHEHFPTSYVKVTNAAWLHEQEELFRTNALGNFRNLLLGISTDKAMLIYLDNNNNSGTSKDREGNLIPPNENYARELLQLFALGTDKLRPDGTPVLDSSGRPVPAYSETDVKEVARALTGWGIDRSGEDETVIFQPELHDSGNKRIFGKTIRGRSGPEGAQELANVVDLILAQPSHAPYISKILIQKLATETPSPQYVADVARIYQSSRYSIRAAVQALFEHPDFTSDAVVLTQYRTPIEQFVGAMRALGASYPADGTILTDWLVKARHQVYFPPSVFSFYRPGKKVSLINTSLALYRDQFADALVTGYGGTSVPFRPLITANSLNTPEKLVDFLAKTLVGAPLSEPVRSTVLEYLGGQTSEEKFRGATWLVLCSPDFQRN